MRPDTSAAAVEGQFQGNAAPTIAASKRQDWVTPPELLDMVRRVFKDGIDLDPCSNAGSLVGATRAVSLPEDGLLVDWMPYWTAFINPPYSPIGLLRAFVTKTREGGEAGRQRILLLPSATETLHFHEDVFASATRICFPKGRLTFIDPLTGKTAEGPQRKASAIAYWGNDPWLFNHAFRDLGKIIHP